MTTLQAPSSLRSQAQPLLRATEALDDAAFQMIRRRLVLEHCKWDPQVGDVSVIAPFALMMPASIWGRLSRIAERLTAETLQIEQRLVLRPDLHTRLGLVRPLRRLFCNPVPHDLTPTLARIMRFDFHPTPDGWRISEVNSDVPGGFTESSALTSMMCDCFPNGAVPGNPAADLADAIAAQSDGPVALVSAPGFMEDQQITAYLAQLLRARGVESHLAQPHHLEHSRGHAHLRSSWSSKRLGGIVRFYQAEWLARLPRRFGWRYLFANSQTPVTNPAPAILSESKRLPLIWGDLDLDIPTWRTYLPETRDAREVAWCCDDQWLLKTAYCNTGDTVTVPAHLPPRRRNLLRLQVALSRHEWLAQRRFATTTIDTPHGQMSPCIGIYTIDGRVAGAYARLSRQPIVTYSAMDVALLIEPDVNGETQ